MNATTASLPAAPAASGFGAGLARLPAALMRALQASGQARAREHLLEFADRCESLQPELAKELRMAVRHGASA